MGMPHGGGAFSTVTHSQSAESTTLSVQSWWSVIHWVRQVFKDKLIVSI